WTATLLLVVDWYSQVVGAVVHQYSHLIRNLNSPSPPMIQLRHGIPPASLERSPKPTEHRKVRPEKTKNAGLHFERVFSDASVAPFDQIEWDRRTAEIND